MAASIYLGIPRIPVWEVDDQDEIGNWENTLIRAYLRGPKERRREQRIPIAQVCEQARYILD